MATETWVINDVLVFDGTVTAVVSFESNGYTFGSFKVHDTTRPPFMQDVTYDSGWVHNQTTGWYSQAYRTITLDSPATGDFLVWLQDNAVKQASGYTISYSTSHGTAPSSVSDITEITSSMLPELSASGYIFGGWFYESTFTTLAQAGDALTADTTLYAKWTVDPDYLIKGSTLTAIGDAIRAYTGESGTITPEQMPGKIAEVAEKAVEDFEEYIMNAEY